jgi:hypothetical protein
MTFESNRKTVREAVEVAWDEQVAETFQEVADAAIDAVFPTDKEWREPIEDVIAEALGRSPINAIHERRYELARAAYSAMQKHYTEGRPA